MQTGTKKRLITFSGFTVVIIIISAAATGYLFHRRMQDGLRQHAFMIKRQGMMLKARGSQIQELSAQILSSVDSGPGNLPDESQIASFRRDANAIRKHGTELEQYGGKLMRKIHDRKPEDALTTMEDMQFFIPEDLNRIKEQQVKIQELETSAMLLRTRIQELKNQLINCRKQQWRNFQKQESF